MATYHLYHFQSGRRGSLIMTFARYKDLVAEARRLAKAAGYPVSRWMDIYDWSKD
jgi:hypothetical protein